MDDCPIRSGRCKEVAFFTRDVNYKVHTAHHILCIFIVFVNRGYRDNGGKLWLPRPVNLSYVILLNYIKQISDLTSRFKNYGYGDTENNNLQLYGGQERAFLLIYLRKLVLIDCY